MEPPTYPDTTPIPQPVEIVYTGGVHGKHLQERITHPLQAYHRRRHMHPLTQTQSSLSFADLPP